MNFNPSDDESMLFLTVANATLLTSLFTNNFLNSDYYNNMEWRTSDDNKIIIKGILRQKGLDNAAMMFMQLYSLFVLPKELLGSEYEVSCKDGFNELIIGKQKGIQSNYRNEDSNIPSTINFFKHIRNSISHANYEFCKYQNTACVRFKDIDTHHDKAEFSVYIPTDDISCLSDYLCKQLMGILNKRIKNYQKLQNTNETI